MTASQEIINFIKLKYPNDSGIIYCVTRKRSENVAKELKKAGILEQFYHTGLPGAQQNRI